MDVKHKKKACAACTYQRKRCKSNCVLAPYFPADKPKELLNANRLFGISNMKNALKEIKDDGDKNNMMESIIFESDMRAKYPVHGCLGIIKMYEGMIKESLQELDDVEELLNLCKLFHQQNLLYFFSMDHSLVPSTSSQIPNFPMDVNNTHVLENLDDNNTSCMQNDPLQEQTILPYFSINHSSVSSTSSQIPDILPYFSKNHSSEPSTSSQIQNFPLDVNNTQVLGNLDNTFCMQNDPLREQNILPYFSMNHSWEPSNSSQILDILP
ncbi:unnamed protein product [Trifolium pratense]|uniref:Uncharacterized protein n=1 Tax=Trifolium pratense TaxID=57577 RepID=A0ACB0LB14_TRIPR|nr:unnamed protein product [Trifolium pratense]